VQIIFNQLSDYAIMVIPLNAFGNIELMTLIRYKLLTVSNLPRMRQPAESLKQKSHPTLELLLKEVVTCVLEKD